MKEVISSYRWVIWALCFMAYTGAIVGRLNLPPIAPFIIADLGLTRTELGLLVAAFSLPVVLTAMPVGWIIDRVGVRKIMVVGQLIVGVFTMSMVFMQSFPQGFVLRFLAGVGLGFIMPAPTKAVMVWFSKRERATVMGLNQTGVNIGGLVCAFTLPILAMSFGWRLSFIVTGFISLPMMVLTLILYREQPATSAGAGAVSVTDFMTGLREAVNREVLLVALSGLCFGMVEFALISYIVLYAKEVLLTTVVVGGILLATAEGAGAFGKPFFGFLSDKVFRGNRKPSLMLLGCILVVCSTATMLMPAKVSLPVFGVLFAVFGLTGIGWGGLNLTFTGEFAGRERAATAAGFSLMITLIGCTLGPPIFGCIIDTTESYFWAWFFLAVCSTIGTLLISLIRESRRKM